MVTLDFRTLISPVGIVRILEVIFTCISFSLVAAAGYQPGSFWTWSMFTWCFCFCVTVIILLMEFSHIGEKLPISWSDFMTAFAMLSTLMMLTTSIIYSRFYVCSLCSRQIGASVTSWIAFILYAVEVGLIRARSGEISGFLSTVPGLLKVLEVFVACIIFICLDYNDYTQYAGLQWCVAVYSICFIFAILVILFTICRLLTLFPAPFDKVLTCCNLLAVLMYITVVVIWPLYSFKNNPKPNHCINFKGACAWDMLIVISLMTCLNLIAYIVDTVYSFRLVFFVART
ncbi:myeloid-associated differentiation marker homolog [Gouania willdenowi]|uniref:Myeloid-associated differentiation marker homolog n=1 Tax=Gouania willdenowi TaxID=441366 RepID=A0A8C5E8U0_GOUWI|nr:myeloid-associated differentiation marker homolog [Gouania willdenowi]